MRTITQIERDISAVLQERAHILRACGGQPEDDDRDELRDLDARNAQLHSELSGARNAIPGQERSMTGKPTFELYESFGRNSVQSEPQPAVSLTATAIMFNTLALDALDVQVGDRLCLYFSRDAGIVALAKPPDDWPAAKSLKLGAIKGGAAATLPGLGTFLKWSGIEAPKAKGIYHLVHDDEHGRWQFALPAGSWRKPTVGTPAVRAENGASSAQRRNDLPATSPHRRAAS
jgi:hypothetical protein